MMELNAEQIKKALECCSADTADCHSCPYGEFSEGNCFDNAKKDSLALITSQEQRIKELTEENERLRAENAKYEAENHAEFNKWLKLEEATKRHHAELFEEAKIAVKADTVRKMQELVRKKIKKTYWLNGRAVYVEIDKIAKEMLEANNERT